MQFCRWSLASSQDRQSLTFQCTTCAPVEEGEEALISYGNNSSWSYLLFYGFVPLRNVHDRVVLFDNLLEAVDWFLDRFPPKVLFFQSISFTAEGKISSIN